MSEPAPLLMKMTLDWLACLLEHGWRVEWSQAQGKFRYVAPGGVSPVAYADDLDHFPAEVWEWVCRTVPRMQEVAKAEGVPLRVLLGDEED